MRKWILAIIVIFISGILFFIICKPDDQDLGENYYYLPKYEAIDIGYSGGGIVYKSPKKGSFSAIKIHGNVSEADANKDFIIASQNADTSYIKTIHSNAAKQESIQYFIIEKKSDFVYGPYKKEEYLQKREELKIPKDLKLNE